MGEEVNGARSKRSEQATTLLLRRLTNLENSFDAFAL